MSTYGPLIDDGSQTTAAASLATKQYFAVKLTAANAVNLASTGGEAIYGILQNAPLSGQVCDVGILGISKAVIGSAGCAAGDPLMTDTTGALTTKTSTNTIVAVALTAGASGQIITVKIIPSAG